MIGKTQFLAGMDSHLEYADSFKRAWCLYEVAHTKEGCLHVLPLVKNGDRIVLPILFWAFMMQNVPDIEKMEATFPDDIAMIRKKLLLRFKDVGNANRVCRLALQKGCHRAIMELLHAFEREGEGKREVVEKMLLEANGLPYSTWSKYMKLQWLFLREPFTNETIANEMKTTAS